MDLIFEHRTRSYRACVMLLLVATPLTLVGFSTSHWVDRGQSHYGLWVQCSVAHQRHHLVCVRHDGSTPLDDILRSPQILITMEITVLVISCIVAILTNCRRYIPTTRQRYLEILVCVAGLLGVAGCSLFWADRNRLDAENLVISMLSWSFFLVLLPSIILLVIAGVISCNDDIIPGSDEISFSSTSATEQTGTMGGQLSKSPCLNSEERERGNFIQLS